MAFSASMQLADLDYIAPSQACILPVMKKTAAAPTAGMEDLGGGLTLNGSAPPEEVVKITLADCLACSGCVTTAETLLVTQQSREEIVQLLAKCDAEEDPQPLPSIVVSLSDQSIAAIAVATGTSLEEASAMISGFCRTVLRAKFVVDTRWAQRTVLQETVNEFFHRMENEPKRLPMIVSSCPGWVCYCEKTHPQLLPFLSNVLSAQALVGSYVKARLPDHIAAAEDSASSSSSIYHISIQPCFDKKLEAARGDFGNEETGTRDTDCVLSTQELLDWMKEVDPALPWRHSLNTNAEPLHVEPPAALGCEATSMEGSGGYHQRLLVEIAKRKFGTDVPLAELKYETKRNANHKVVTLPLSDAAQMEVCVAYGFQHIQNIVRGLNRKMASVRKYVFVELMACPDGCLNGGGQIRTGSQQKATLASVTQAYEAYNNSCNCAKEGAGSSPAGSETSSSAEAPPARKQRGEESSSPSEWIEPQMIPSPGSSDDGLHLFTSADVYQWAKSQQNGFKTDFHDRKKEMEEGPSQALLHSLKW